MKVAYGQNDASYYVAVNLQDGSPTLQSELGWSYDPSEPFVSCITKGERWDKAYSYLRNIPQHTGGGGYINLEDANVRDIEYVAHLLRGAPRSVSAAFNSCLTQAISRLEVLR